LIHIGLETEKQLNEVGINTYEELRALGAEQAWLKIQEIDESACINRLLGLEGALQGMKKTLLPDDHCLVAEADGKIVGAVWVRIMNDYGHVDDETPSFAISLCKEYRGLGLGTEMMKKMLYLLKTNGYKKASLAVQKANYAAKMYQRMGFEIVNENEEEYIMVNHL